MTDSAALSELVADDAADPVVEAAIEQAEAYEEWLRGKPLSAHQAMVLVLLRTVRELRAENEELRRLR
jgi:hypothetical protein